MRRSPARLLSVVAIAVLGLLPAADATADGASKHAKPHATAIAKEQPARKLKAKSKKKSKARSGASAVISLTASSGPRNSNVKVKGFGFARNRGGSIRFRGVRVANIRTDGHGKFSKVMTVPSSAPLGSTTVLASAGRHPSRGTATFTVTSTVPSVRPSTPTPSTPTPSTPTPSTPTPSAPTPPSATTPGAVPPAKAAPTITGAGALVSTNPLAAVQLYVDPYGPARRQADAWRSTRPADAAELDKIAKRPQADWFGEWSGPIEDSVRSRVDSAAAAGAAAVLVAYNIPQRDCGSYSAGGVGSSDAYRAWIRSFAKGIGTRSAIVILEPDALAMLDCLSAIEQASRLALLKDAVEVLEAQPAVSVYLDAGHSNWIGAADMASRLTKTGVAHAQGFALNVSNYRLTAELVAYGKDLSARLGGKHFVIDTSRNGLGPRSDGQWCNPSGRALGPAPTVATGEATVDAYLWIKKPGESDGTCNGGPSTGTFWADYALGLAQRAL